MDCLKDYIGIKGYGSQEPLSGLYINQLPGITLESIDKIADKDQGNFTGVWDDVQTRAGNRLEKDLRIALRNRFKLKGIKSFSVAKPVLSEDTIEAAEEYRGVIIDLGIDKSAFLAISVNQITLNLPGTVTSLVLKIFELTENDECIELLTKTKANASGKCVINIARKFSAKKIFIAVDATTAELLSAEYNNTVAYDCFRILCDICEDCKPSISGASSLVASPGEITKSDEVYGIEVGFSVMCDLTSIACFNKPEFTDVWMYLLGAELMIERSFSSRLNRYTTIDREQASELSGYFTAQYEKALKEAVNAIELKDDCCIECNPLVRTTTSLP
jgi:hypothetical protein